LPLAKGLQDELDRCNVAANWWSVSGTQAFARRTTSGMVRSSRIREIGARVGPFVGLLDGDAGGEVGNAADVGSTIPALICPFLNRGLRGVSFLVDYSILVLGAIV
jgi:hypothetical protein